MPIGADGLERRFLESDATSQSVVDSGCDFSRAGFFRVVFAMWRLGHAPYWESNSSRCVLPLLSHNGHMLFFLPLSTSQNIAIVIGFTSSTDEKQVRLLMGSRAGYEPILEFWSTLV